MKFSITNQSCRQRRTAGKRRQSLRSLQIQSLECRHLLAGPYAPAAGQAGSTAISSSDPSIVSWATAVANYSPGSDVDAGFRDAEKAVGPAEGTAADAVSLGRGGVLELEFSPPIFDGLGPDFAVFENAFSDDFLELGYVEVSSDGVNFVRFENDSQTPSAVGAFGTVEPTDIHNLAGKYRQGFGTPFDLAELSGAGPTLDLSRVTHVRLVDIVGDGSRLDSSGDPIYDPFPTTGSAGLDVDAVGAIHATNAVVDRVHFEDVGSQLGPQSAFSGPDPSGTTVVGPFNDSVVLGSFQSETLSFNNAHSIDFGSWNQWAYSNATNTTTPGFTNQFSSFAGGGAGGSATFGVGFAGGSSFFAAPTISREPGDVRPFQSLMVTNTTYAALSMRDGDSFAKKFGGTSGNDPDFFRLTITGRDSTGNSIGTVQHFLADYRFADNSQDFIVDQWQHVDLTSIGRARTLEFSLTTTDVGPLGGNTPAYFAIDDITLVNPGLAISLDKPEVSESDGPIATTVRVTRSGDDLSNALRVTLSPVDPQIASLPSFVTIPSGRDFVEFSVGVVNNDVADGDRQITLGVSASGYLGDSQNLSILDDDPRRLSLSANDAGIAEGGTLVATIRRNDANLSRPLTVQVAVSRPELASTAATVTIGAGQDSATFAIDAIDDDIDRPDHSIEIVATALGYLDATLSLDVADNDQATVGLVPDPDGYSESQSLPTSGLEYIGRRLPAQGFYNGSDGGNGFQSGSVGYNNEFDPTFGSWSGWSYSNVTDTTTPGFTNQYAALPGAGGQNSDTFAVATAFPGTLVPTLVRDPLRSDGFHSIEVTNTTYAGLSMLHGDAFAKKFGGQSGDDPDFFLLTIEGFDASEASVGSVDFYLADFRFEDNSMDYVVDEWSTVDLSPIGEAVQLKFSLSSSDVGAFGINTPAYFAVDNVTMTSDDVDPMVTVRRNSQDVSSELLVTMSSSDTSMVVIPNSITIPAGSSSIDVPIRLIDDAIVDGKQTVTLSVAAPGHVSSDTSIAIEDDDVAELTLTVLTPTIAEADGEGRAVVHRNDGDTNQAKTIEIAADLPNQVLVPSQITIPAGQRSVEFTFAAIDNSDDDGNRQVTFNAAVPGSLSGSDTVLIVDEDRPPPMLTLEIGSQRLDEADALPTVMLEDVGATLDDQSFYNGSDQSFYNGSDQAGGFASGKVRFNNSYDPMFESWSGWAVSNTTDQLTTGFQNQYSAITGGGAGDSSTYVVGNAFPGGFLPSIEIEQPSSGEFFQSLQVTNSTYAALSMRDGDAFAKKFGGPTGDDPDFLELTITGYDPDGDLVGTIDFALADFRFEENELDYIVDTWTRVDVTELTGATRLTFSLASSDVGEFGMNTPAYFAVDNIVLTDPSNPGTTATISRSGPDVSEPLLVHLQLDDPSEVDLSSQVVIPSGASSATFTMRPADDAVVDGTKSVRLTAAAEGHTSSSDTVQVDDDDRPQLMVSLSQTVVDEPDTENIELLVHRNSEDNQQPLPVDFSTSGNVLLSTSSITIPAGKSSQSVRLMANDNGVRDGDRQATIDAFSEGWQSGSTTLLIRDDETSELLIVESDGATIVNELLGKDELFVSLKSQPLSEVLVEILGPLDDLSLDISQLSFTPDQWDQPQKVTVEGRPDLELETDEIVSTWFSLDVTGSDPFFVDAPPMAVDIVVQDHQSTRLRITEDDSQTFVTDADENVRITSKDHSEGIDVVVSDQSQTLILDPLARTSGLVQIDARGGDDSVMVLGSRFTSLNGGDGYDRLILDLSEPVELVDFLDSRSIGFEEIVLASQTGAELSIATGQLFRIQGADRSLLLRVQPGQSLRFSEPGISESPVMVGDDFAQVIRSGDAALQVISPTPWQNVLSRWDVDRSGDLSALDALSVINELPQLDDPMLPALTSTDLFTGAYFDVSGDGRLTTLDALHVINEIARRQLVDRAIGELVQRPNAWDAVAPSQSDDEPRASLSPQPLAKGKTRKLVLISAPEEAEIRRASTLPAEHDAVQQRQVADTDKPLTRIE